MLPSPNGSAIAAASRSPVVAGCPRNASAAGRWLAEQQLGTSERPVTVIAAGERWPDNSLRPALEDLVGAGAIIAALHRQAAAAVPLSPEAAAARACFQATRDIAAAVTHSGSTKLTGQHLVWVGRDGV